MHDHPSSPVSDSSPAPDEAPPASASASRRSFLRGATLLGSACAAGCVSAQTEPAVAEPLRSATFDVSLFGARGDGVTDDTVAIQAAADAAIARGGGCVCVPSGRYRVTRSIRFSSSDHIDVTGAGRSSVLLHENDEPLLLWTEHASCRNSTVRDLCFDSVANDKSVDTPVLACRGGAERAFFSNLFFSATGARMGSGLVVDGVMDTTTLDHCLLWGVTGTGVRVARGSEVRIVGGRIIGATNPYQGIGAGSTGVHLAGGNGGVHILTTDIISLGTCLKIGEPGAVSNREVFITHATFDSSTHGLWQVDNAYTSIAGCWAASSDEDQILIDETSPGAILVVTGGTIFNGGAYGRPGAHNGIDIRAGSFVLSGTTVRHNKGTGIQVGENVHDYAITGCRILNNGTGVVLAGARYAFTGNVVAHNQTALVDHGGEDRVLQANVGIG